jgi:hypothetical protein
VYYGYAAVRIHVASSDLWVPEVLEVTEHLEELLRDRWLPGELWRLWRKPTKRRTRPCVGEYVETRAIDGVFDAWDHRPVVCRMYHTERICWGAENPVPPRVQLQAVHAPPPPAAQGPTEPAAGERTYTRAEMYEFMRRGQQPAPANPNGKK